MRHAKRSRSRKETHSGRAVRRRRIVSKPNQRAGLPATGDGPRRARRPPDGARVHAGTRRTGRGDSGPAHRRTEIPGRLGRRLSRGAGGLTARGSSRGRATRRRRPPASRAGGAPVRNAPRPPALFRIRSLVPHLARGARGLSRRRLQHQRHQLAGGERPQPGGTRGAGVVPALARISRGRRRHLRQRWILRHSERSGRGPRGRRKSGTSRPLPERSDPRCGCPGGARRGRPSRAHPARSRAADSWVWMWKLSGRRSGRTAPRGWTRS